MNAEITELIVCCRFGDGKVRHAKITPDQSLKLRNVLQYVSGGTIKCYAQPVVIMTDKWWLRRKLHSLGVWLSRRKFAQQSQ